MNDEQLQSLLEEEFRTMGTTPEDVEGSTRRVMERKAHVRQRSRWWPFPVFYRRHDTPTASDTTDYQSSPIPASNGHTPTAIGRTSSMLSPVKAITAGALVFAIGGAMLIAQPFQQQASVPGAETEAGVAEDTPFTMSFSWRDPSVRSAVTRTEDGLTKSIGECWAPAIVAPSDPRMDGTLEYCGSEHVYGQDREKDTLVWTETYRITNEEGAWQGSGLGAWWEDPGSAERLDAEGAIILVGEGAYDGLYAALTFLPDWRDIRGVIFEGAPPANVVPPSVE